MNIEIKNISKVKGANIKLDGLTVIAGENGSGKSTVGKMLFSVIQVLKSTREESLHKSNNLLDKHIQALYTRLKNVYAPVQQNFVKNLFPATLKRQLQTGELTVSQLRDMLFKTVDNEVALSPRTKANIEKDLKNIELTIDNSNNRAAVQAGSIQSLIESEFMNSACSDGTAVSSVKFNDSESDNAFISFSLQENTVRDVSTSGRETIEDATYVESPLYLHLIDTLNYSIQYVEIEGRQVTRSGMIPTHIKDFVSKMIYAKSVSGDLFSEGNEMVDKICGVMKGTFQFDRNSNKLYYVQKGRSYSPINTASGAKAFGVLQLLLQSETINSNRILIWDEPENHLHPDWQVQFADVIMQLAVAGIPIVISTHSPYFLQAIRFYAAQYEAERNVNYYFAETDDDGLSEINEVTDDLNRIFIKLAETLHRIMNIPNPKH